MIAMVGETVSARINTLQFIRMAAKCTVDIAVTSNSICE